MITHIGKGNERKERKEYRRIRIFEERKVKTLRKKEEEEEEV